jgi:oligopeptide transport system substrate-binding protein
MTAHDVVYSLNRLADPGVSSRPGILASVTGISAPDDYTVTLTLARRSEVLLPALTMINAAVVPRAAVERGDFGIRPVGTGPFEMDERESNRFIRLRRFDGYFRGPAALPSIEYRVLRDRAQGLMAFRSGEVDICEVPLSHLAALRQDPRMRARLLEWRNLNTWFVWLDLRRPPFKDNAPLRRALNCAVDREYLCRELYEGLAVPAAGVLPPGTPGFDAGSRGYPFNPDEARRLLAEAGFPEGRGLPEIPIYYSDDPDRQPFVVKIARDLEAVGVRVRPAARESNSLRALIRDQGVEMYFHNWVADYPDPENFLYSLFHSSNGKPGGNFTNYAHYDEPAVDRMMERAETLRGAERIAAYREAERRVVEDAPAIFLFHRKSVILVSARVKGLTVTPMDAGVDFCGVSLWGVSVEK